MANPDREAAANFAGWVVAAMVAVVAICAVTFMITTQPNPAPAIAAAESETLRGATGPSTLEVEIARSQADQAARMAQQSAATAQAAAAEAAANAAVAGNAPSADAAGQNAGSVEPIAPLLEPDGTLANSGTLGAP